MPGESRLSRFALPAALVILNFSPFMRAQSGAAQVAVAAPTILISAHNKDGSPAELAAADLEIKIDGKPATVQAVQSLGRPTLRYCLLFDTSASERPRMRQHQEEAIAVLKSLQPGRDYGLLVRFFDRPYLDAEGTDPDKLMRAVEKEDSRGGTALYDAMVACADKMWKTASASDVRVMFILSDGEDNASNVRHEKAVEALVKAGIRAYAIGQRNDTYADDRSAKRGVGMLNLFAERTGGKAYFPKDEKDVAKGLNEISNELASVSSVSISSTQPLPSEHVYKVELKCRKKNISLNAPQQYFVPPQ